MRKIFDLLVGSCEVVGEPNHDTRLDVHKY